MRPRNSGSQNGRDSHFERPLGRPRRGEVQEHRIIPAISTKQKNHLRVVFLFVDIGVESNPPRVHKIVRNNFGHPIGWAEGRSSGMSWAIPATNVKVKIVQQVRRVIILNAWQGGSEGVRHTKGFCAHPLEMNLSCRRIIKITEQESTFICSGEFYWFFLTIF